MGAQSATDVRGLEAVIQAPMWSVIQADLIDRGRNMLHAIVRIQERLRRRSERDACLGFERRDVHFCVRSKMFIRIGSLLIPVGEDVMENLVRRFAPEREWTGTV